ncbi:hypothetical protein [Mesorhizobium sp. M1396]|uniref:hypothetical protein n=1 Tax=Mesorhizobium sp. M1396 TaxID=2957095 RepID=UPI003337B037
MSARTQRVKHRVRLLQLLAAADRAALAPISIDKLHAFAYLADILSPVWNLRPFEDRIGRTGRAPYYPDLQRELDFMVAMGLVLPSDISYVRKEGQPAVLTAHFALPNDSATVKSIRSACGNDAELAAQQTYLNALADALASLPDDDISAAATHDLVYEKSSNESQDFIDLASLSSRTSRAVASFDKAFPGTKLTPARRLVMYAHYLGHRVHA